MNQPLGAQPSFQNGEAMTADEAYLLNEAQLAYEYDYNNPKKAYEYFAELNKHQYFVTVVKEHDEFLKRIA